MVVDLARIERLEEELREAKAQLWKEDGDRYRILIREMSEVERNRILGSLMDRRERILFGLDAPVEGKGAGTRPGASGGDLECPICGKSGLTKRGLALHTIRMHGVETGKEEGKAA
jgi:hypothetical protein